MTYAKDAFMPSKFLLDPREVSFDDLVLDPNNPRLAIEDPPGYEDPDATFAYDQEDLEKRVRDAYDVGSLEASIMGNGWNPVDWIFVWPHPKKKNKFLVVEGNTRTVVLRDLRKKLISEERKLADLKKKKKEHAAHDLDEQKAEVARLRKIVDDTAKIEVRPVAAKTAEELEALLPRLLGVRHLTGAKEWHPYPEGLFVLGRYTKIFKDQFPGQALRIESEIVKRVAQETSLGDTKTRRKIQAASSFSHFRMKYADKLPTNEKFEDGDHYAFTTIVAKTFLQNQFGLGPSDLHLSNEGEKALFAWLFSKPRGKTAKENKNTFVTHERLRVWAEMSDWEGSNPGVPPFAARFDVSDPKSAPPFDSVKLQWEQYQARVEPVELLHELIAGLEKLPFDVLGNQAAVIGPMLDRLEVVTKRAKKYVAIEREEEASADGDDGDADGDDAVATKTSRRRKV